MCGRTACTLAPDEVLKACTYRDGQGKRRRPTWVDAPGGHQYRTSYNMAPGSHTPVVVASCHHFNPEMEGIAQRLIVPMKWGLTPQWHKGDPYKVPYETNNCRMEGMLEKKTYKIPLQKGQRCVVLADGFYEWKTDKGGKQPYFFYFPQTNMDKKESVIGTQTCSTVHETKSSKCLFDEAIKKELKTEGDVNDLHGIKSEIFTNVKSEAGSPECEKCTGTSFSPMSWKWNSEGEENDSPRRKMTSFWDVETLPCQNKLELVKSENDASATKDQHDAHVTCCEPNQKVGVGDAWQEDVDQWEGKRLLTMAAVFDVWKENSNSAPMYSYSIITVPSSKDMDWCHHRMPAILSTEEEVQDWLDTAHIPLSKAVELIKPQCCLTSHPVSKVVNNSRHNASDCIQPIDLKHPKQSPSSKFMMNWLKSGSPAKKQKI